MWCYAVPHAVSAALLRCLSVYLLLILPHARKCGAIYRLNCRYCKRLTNQVASINNKCMVWITWYVCSYECLVGQLFGADNISNRQSKKLFSQNLNQPLLHFPCRSPVRSFVVDVLVAYTNFYYIRWIMFCPWILPTDISWQYSN